MTVFICTHGRDPSQQYTYNMLRECGYTGRIILIMDDEDDKVNEYIIRNYPYKKFNKQYYIDTVDIGRSDAKRAAILYAKCYCEDLAKEMEEDEYVIADDDIVNLRYRYYEDGKFRTVFITSGLDDIFKAYFKFIKDGNICMTSFGTNQMYMGGKVSDDRVGEYRIPYNFLFRNGKIPFRWISEMNEDTASVLYDHSGSYMIQLPFIKLEMKPLMAGADGGMTDSYNALTVFDRVGVLQMYAPTVVEYYPTSKKITHKILRDKAFPKLISSKYQLKQD